MRDNPIQCPDDQDDFDARLASLSRDQNATYSHNDFTDFERGEYDCLMGYRHRSFESEEYDEGYAKQYQKEQNESAKEEGNAWRDFLIARAGKTCKT
jgi:hypothetical protein